MTPIGWVTPGVMATVGTAAAADVVAADPAGATAATAPTASAAGPTARAVTLPLRTCPSRSGKETRPTDHRAPNDHFTEPRANIDGCLTIEPDAETADREFQQDLAGGLQRRHLGCAQLRQPFQRARVRLGPARAGLTQGDGVGPHLFPRLAQESPGAELAGRPQQPVD